MSYQNFFKVIKKEGIQKFGEKYFEVDQVGKSYKVKIKNIVKYLQT